VNIILIHPSGDGNAPLKRAVTGGAAVPPRREGETG
jgi:hypothetical protein